MALPESITVNETVYATAELTEESRSQAASIQVVDAEIARLQQLLAIAQTARIAYGAALIGSLKAKPDGKADDKPSDKPRKASNRAKKA